MKSIIISAAALMALLFSACNQEAKPTGTAAPARETAPQQPATAPVAAAGPQITDPVCGMVKDSTWTDYTVYKGDTVWFCSAPEKTAFLAKPEKYTHNLISHSTN